MKTCSKCKHELHENCFVKSDRYKDGLYPSCKECRKKVLHSYLHKNSMCAMCGNHPHMKSNAYCRMCIRIINNLPIERERPNVDRNNKTMCCGCKVNPRRKGGHYCIECANAMQRLWIKENWKEYINRGNNREKINARAYVNYMVSEGKLEKTPCTICGNAKSEAHHHNGYDFEHRLDVVWLCKTHHVEADRAMKKNLTTMPH